MELGGSEGQPEASQADEAFLQPLGMKMPDTKTEVTAKQSGQPLVSVIIPTYNRSWALGKSVGSVLEQTYRPIECVIIDDGSTDDTSDVVKRLIRKCPEGVRIRYYKKENGGVNSARNRGLLGCKGAFVCYLDSDDMLTRDSISERARVFIEDPDVDFCYGLASIRDENGNETGRMNTSWPTSDEARISRYLFNTNSPLIRRSTCAKVGLWREDDLHGQEHEYFARLKYFSNKVIFIDKILSVYVKHKNESIFDRSLPFSLALFRILLTVKALILYGKYDNKHERRQLSREFRGVAKQLFDLKDYSNACAALQESLILKFKVKVFAEWLIVKVIGILKMRKIQLRSDNQDLDTCRESVEMPPSGGRR